jgi:beta-aspartyl-peptidase (threonine type)
MRAGEDPASAASAVLPELRRAGGDGGLILVDPRGRLGFAFNSQRMARAWILSDGTSASGFD